MDLAELTAKADSAVEAGGDFTKKVKFDFGDAGKLFIDGVAGKRHVCCHAAAEPDEEVQLISLN
jgi:hypothetical protein